MDKRIGRKQIVQSGIVALLLFSLIWQVWENEVGHEEAPQFGQESQLSWYSDYIFWNPPIEAGSGSEKITEHTGVRIEYIIPEDNGDIRLSLMMTNRSMPDIVSVSDRYMIRHLVESGEVWKIDELMETYLPDSHLLTDYPEDVKEKLIHRDGGWYGLASNLHSEENKKRYGQPDAFWEEMQRQKSDYGIIWNRALLKRMGISLNQLGTEEEVIAAFGMAQDKEITVNGKPVIPLLVDGSRYQRTTLQVLSGFFGAETVDGQGGYREGILTEEGKHTLRFLNEMVQDDYVSPDQFVMTPYQVKRTLNSGQVLCFVGDIINSGIDPEEWVSNGVILSSDGAKPVLPDACRESRSMTTFISKSCENPEAAAKWLDYVTSEEGMAAYLEDNEWWPLRNDDWYYSVKQEPDEREIAWKQLLCAYVRKPETRMHRPLPMFPASNQRLRELETAVNSYITDNINTLIMEESQENFERGFAVFIEDLELRGIRELETLKRDFCISNTGNA
ncbi:MAG: extracellular solute-binding protein [Lachnospiraceae bacterium]|nr:extracellular solute-binding protein [Lachnospiraceae bacterium]MCI9650623.1 extracellular solute-binding protein [Lachnospiraceae bacterium]